MADALPVELQDFGLTRTLITFLTPRESAKCSQQPTRVTINHYRRSQLQWKWGTRTKNWVPWKKATELGDRLTDCRRVAVTNRTV